MADTVQCPICEYVVPLFLEEQPSLVSLLLEDQPKIDPAAVEVVEADLRKHLEAHTVEEWTRAFVMADRYIAKLEADLADAEQRLALERQSAPTRVLSEAMDDLDRQVLASVSVPPPQAGALRYPNGRPDPDQTLIPQVPASTRPEGMVGRKT